MAEFEYLDLTLQNHVLYFNLSDGRLRELVCTPAIFSGRQAKNG
jgi:hypothetical protein